MPIYEWDVSADNERVIKNSALFLSCLAHGENEVNVPSMKMRLQKVDLETGHVIFEADDGRYAEKFKKSVMEKFNWDVVPAFFRPKDQLPPSAQMKLNLTDEDKGYLDGLHISWD